MHLKSQDQSSDGSHFFCSSLTFLDFLPRPDADAAADDEDGPPF